jgi:predicted regulator of Ras-like GTPase activity (Roadblock/LC7/MglB family)
MTAAEALADLDDLSTQVRTAVLFRPDGTVLASTLGDEQRAGRLAEAAQAALDAAGRIRGHGEARVTGLEAAVRGGSLFVAAGTDHVVAATTAPDEPAGLVLYDLRTCLRRLEGDA